MKKIKNLWLSLLGLVALSCLSSCTKIYDKIFRDDKPPKKCRIVSFTQDNIPFDPGTRTAQFYYNKHGNIDSIIAFPATGSLGAHLFYFIYDKSHRLIAYREDAAESYPYREEHWYVYEQGRIVRDSSRIYPDGNFTEVRTLEYDNKGRIVVEHRKTIYDDGTVVDNDPLLFNYDAEGNLELESATYDEGRNFLSTSDELMFTQRDYSKNNRTGATGYNDSGLPLGFADGIWASYGNSSLFSFGLPDEIEYSCDGQGK